MMKLLENWALEPKFERWGFNGAYAAITLSGAAYFVMKYLMATDDPFAVVNHPWEPTMLAIHVIAGPIAITLFSLAFRSHGLPQIWQAARLNRKSGLAAGSVFLVLVGSGYLNQVATDPIVLEASIWTHVGAGGVFVATYAIHLVVGYHPWEPTMLAIHVIAGPIAITLFSLAFRSHGLPQIWQAARLNRKSGLAAGSVFLVLVGSGYLNQVATDPIVLEASIWTHVGAGGVFVATYAIHLVVGYRAAWARKREAAW